MAYTTAIANLTIDNAHADGRKTKFNVGRDWLAAESKEQPRQFTPDVGGQYGWQYQNKFEYLQFLKAIAPIGSASWADMNISNWSVSTGSWQETGKAGDIPYKFLHACDGSTGSDNRIVSTGSKSPKLLFWIYRWPPNPNETEPSLFEIIFQGNGSIPELRLTFPGRKSTSTYWQNQTGLSGEFSEPMLLGKPQDLSEWRVIHKIMAGAHGTYMGDTEAQLSVLQVEYDAGWIIVRTGQDREPWVFKGKWQDAANREVNFTMADGPIEVRVHNHTAMFNMQELSYSTSVIRPRQYFFTSGIYNQTPNYNGIYWAPSGTSLSVVSESGGTNRTRPVVTFNCAGSDRPLLFNIQEYRDATIGSANSNPEQTQGNDDLMLLSARGLVTDKWQGARMTCELQAQHGHTLPEIKTNDKAYIQVSTDDGSTSYILFTGYTLPMEKERKGGVGKTEGTLECADGVRARLHQKHIGEWCSLEGWAISDAFEHILNWCGVPSALIDTSNLTGNEADLPTSWEKRTFQFRPDQTPVAALDEICKVRGLQWGVGAGGVYFIRPYPEYTAPADFTIDDNTTTEEDVIHHFRASQNVDEYRNMIKAMVGRGWKAQAKWDYDWASITDPTDAAFIGDDWTLVEHHPDGDDLSTIVDEILRKRTEFEQRIFWETSDYPELAPDQFVEVDQVDNVDITAGTIYRIVRKEWRIDRASGGDFRFRQNLEAVKVDTS